VKIVPSLKAAPQATIRGFESHHPLFCLCNKDSNLEETQIAWSSLTPQATLFFFSVLIKGYLNISEREGNHSRR